MLRVVRVFSSSSFFSSSGIREGVCVVRALYITGTVVKFERTPSAHQMCELCVRIHARMRAHTHARTRART